MVPTLTWGLVRSNLPFAIFPTPKKIYANTTGSRRNRTRTHHKLVPMAGIGPATSPLPRECSTTEPHGPFGTTEAAPKTFQILQTSQQTMERETGIEPASLAWK